MKLITRDTDYALRALSFIASKKKNQVTAGQLVRELKIPLPFLRKILQSLNKGGILESRKGLGGGFLLAKSVDKIFVLDLMEIFQGPLHLNECLFKKAACPRIHHCCLRNKINNIEKSVFSQLKTISLASLAK